MRIIAVCRKENNRAMLRDGKTYLRRGENHVDRGEGKTLKRE